MYASYRRLRTRLVHPLPAEILLIRDNPAADAVGLRPSLDPDPLLAPDAIETEATRPNEIGMHRAAFSVDDIDESLEIAARHGCHPLRGVATYGDVYKLTYVRGPSGIIVMLAEELKKS